MSNQLHRRLAFRTGGGVSDVSTDSFWDTTDLSSAHVYSHMQVYARRRGYTGSGTVSDPYRPTVSHIGIPYYGVGSSVFLGTGTDPIVTFGTGEHISSQNLFLLDLFKSYKYIGRGDSLSRSPINGNVDALSSEYAYTTADNGGESSTISFLAPNCVTCDQARMHWYFLQRGNSTQEIYRVKNSGYIPYYGANFSTTTPTRTVAKVTTNYGLRILHVQNRSGDLYPLEADKNSMMTTFMDPGKYTYGTNGTTVNNGAYGMRRPTSNRNLWDFSLKALEDGDMSPAGYFTGNAPVRMQIVDGGTKMFFLSFLSSNGQELSCRPLTSQFDIRTLSTTATTRSMTDFQSEVCQSLGRSNSRLQWIWFKFHMDGKRLFFLTADGILAKFHLTNAFDMSTMSLVSVTDLPAHDYKGSGIKFEDSTYSGPSSYEATDERFFNPIMGADIDPEGQSLIVAISPMRYVGSTAPHPPMANSFVQYRL